MGLQGWRVLPVTEPISHRATTYIENHALAHGMPVADALIAATAVSERTLVTGNVRHYRFVPGILLEPYGA